MPPRPAANFDRLAGGYRALERVAFGGDLERARFAFLEGLAGRRAILVLGEGDGRCLKRLLTAAPGAEIDCFDASAAMLARASRRLTEDERRRVRFHHADARKADFGEARYDAAVTLFFLDCFTEEETRGLTRAVGRALGPDARWLFADFAEPPRGWRRWRAKAWLWVLYAFFRLETRISARRLPPAERLIEAEGFRVAGEVTLQRGLLRSVVFERV